MTSTIVISATAVRKGGYLINTKAPPAIAIATKKGAFTSKTAKDASKTTASA